MLILAKLIGVAIVGMGTAVAVNPQVLPAIMNFWKKGKNVYLAGTLRLLFGILFLAIAKDCRLPTVISVLGALMVIGGILIFVIGPQRIHKIFDWWQMRPSYVIRLMGLTAFCIGTLIFYSV